MTTILRVQAVGCSVGDWPPPKRAEGSHRTQPFIYSGSVRRPWPFDVAIVSAKPAAATAFREKLLEVNASFSASSVNLTFRRSPAEALWELKDGECGPSLILSDAITLN